MSNKKNKSKTLDWGQFQSMGNPENAPDEPKEKPKGKDIFIAKSTIRIHLEKKGRGGKPVSIIRGLEMTNTMMKEIEKEIKTKCGVGGTQKNGEIIIQGDQRQKILKYFQDKNCKNVKLSGG